MTLFRTEHDLIGPFQVPSDALYGVHTARSVQNFPLTGRRVHPAWIHAMGEVKLACAETSRKLGKWAGEEAKADAIVAACREMASGRLDGHVLVDPLQGGAGTSLNMCIDEVIANRALQILGFQPGDYSHVSPLNDINYQQSTNDVCPSACKIAIIRQIDYLMPELKSLELSFRLLASKTGDVVKMGRTQFQDAVLTTLGFEFKAYAEALSRDFARITQARKAFTRVNLGGTAIGTSVSASHDYVRNVVPTLAEVTGLPLTQNDDLIDGTQNLDDFAMFSGTLKTLAVSLLKISTDLRFMSSGPQAGIAEIALPRRQAGSSIMPGKVNPVIPEAMTQVCLTVIGHDTSITYAASQGQLELNAFLPLIADCILGDLSLLANACRMLEQNCVSGIVPNYETCAAEVSASTALITAMVEKIGYDSACQIGIDARAEGVTIRQKLLSLNLMSSAEIDALTDAKAVRSTMADHDRTHHH